MRKVNLSINEIIEKIKNMQGKDINMEVNRGRKRIEKYVGVIEKVYPSVFTVSIKSPENQSQVKF